MPSNNLKNNYPSLKTLLAALPTDPNNPVIHHALAHLYSQKKDITKAISHYQKALAIDPRHAEAHHNLACLLVKQGEYQKALSHYRDAVHCAPDYLPAHYNLGLLFLKKQQLSSASIQFNNVLSLNPSHIQARYYLGMIQLHQEDLDHAQQTLEMVIAQDPEHCEALNNLGVIALKKNQGQLAVHYFTQVIALDNAHLEARNNLAATFLAHDRFENALIHYRELLKLDNNNIEYLYNAAVALLMLNQLTEAKQFFETLLTRHPDHAATYNNLAVLALRSNNKAEALHFLRKAIMLDPNDHTSQHMLQALDGHKKAPTTPRYAQDLFDNYAFHYDDHVQNTLQYTLPDHLLNIIAKSNLTTPRQHTLDLGCGTGLCGEKLRKISNKLYGVDISPKMLEKARQKNWYDKLVLDNIENFLATDHQYYDLIVAADVLPYFGDLSALFTTIRTRLLPDGLFVFSTEISEEQPWQLQPQARFSHHITYLEELCRAQSWQIQHYHNIIARYQNKQPVWMHIMSLRLP